MKKEFYIKDKARYEVVTDKFWLVMVVGKKSAYGKIRYMVKPLGGGDEIITEHLHVYEKKSPNQ